MAVSPRSGAAPPTALLARAVHGKGWGNSRIAERKAQRYLVPGKDVLRRRFHAELWIVYINTLLEEPKQ